MRRTSPQNDTANALGAAAIERAKTDIVAQLKTCYDPEIPVNIYDLGLIYSVDVSAEGIAAIRMTLTAPNCPAAGILPAEVQDKAEAVEGITRAVVEIVWDPPWDPRRMSDEVKLALGIL